MPSRARSILHLLQLVRLELVLSAVSNIWLTVWLVRHIESSTRRNAVLLDESLWIILALTGTLAACMGAYGIALNDLIDVRHDRAFAPQRPVASGRVPQSIAASLGVACLLAALFAGVSLGQSVVVLSLVVAVAILFYNTTWRYLPAAGIITLALIRGLTMIVPNHQLAVLWPTWLVLTHVVLCGVVVHMLGSKRPRLSVHDVWQLIVGWLVWSGAIVWRMVELGSLTHGMTPLMWALPGGAAVVFIALTIRMLLMPRPQRAPLRFERLGILWLIVYDIAWLIAMGAYRPVVLHVALLIAAATVSGVLQTINQLLHRAPRYHVTEVDPR